MAEGKRKALTRLEKMLRSDGALCVTFLNTASARRKALETYDDLLRWGVETGDLSDAVAARLAEAAAERPGPANGVVRRGRTLTGRLKRVLLAVAGGGKPEAADFAALNAEIRAALANRELALTPGGCEWSWGDGGGDDLDRMLWPVLSSAGDLLASPEVGRVRQCAAPGCDLLFVARGGGKPRKWCSSGCGNRATSRRHYHRRVKPRRLKIEQQRRAKEKRRRDEKERLRAEQKRRFDEEERRRAQEKRGRADAGGARKPPPSGSEPDDPSST